MQAREAVIGGTGLVLGLLLGWSWGGSGPPAAPPPVGAEAHLQAPTRDVPPAPTPERAEAPPSVEPGAPVAPPSEGAPPVVLVESGEMLRAGLGEGPFPWPEDLPEALGPEALDAAWRELAEACGASDLLVDVDCSEPPCLMVFEVPRGGEREAPEPSSCAAWRERYGERHTRANASGMCADGTVVDLLLVAPHIDAVTPKDPSDPFRAMRRLGARAEAAKDAVGCAAPVELRVENRIGWRLQWVPAP